MEDAFVWLDLLHFIVDNQMLECLGGGGGAIQRLVADGGNGRRLISQSLGYLE